MNWLLENKDLLLEIIGAASILAAVIAKLTPNKWDNKAVEKVQWLVDKLALNPIRAAEKAGDDAVAVSPAKGLDSITGTPKDVL